VSFTSTYTNSLGQSLFDFPVVAPGTKATENYISATHGIYEFIRDANVPNGQVGTGNFEIDGEFYNGDPFNGRSDDGYAGSQTVTFTAVETFDVSSTTPEPATWLLPGAGFGVLALWQSRSPRR
jgi:hypothetical protein